jgi:hypothetical protein
MRYADSVRLNSEPDGSAIDVSFPDVPGERRAYVARLERASSELGVQLEVTARRAA